ncbi:MAG: DUF58 domain-containing protein [Acidobacteria bacterium]|nr:DUF58 domain-containing protein [Acidobacteriota bacterium]
MTFTRAGSATVTLALVVGIAGFLLRYPAVVIIASCLLMALIVGAVYTRRERSIETSRELRPNRTTAGNDVTSILTVTNVGRRRIAAGIALETVGADHVPVLIPDLHVGESTVVELDVPAPRRGVYQVGPLLLDRPDPFGLTSRRATDQQLSELIVHPRFYPMESFPFGLTRDLDGQSSGEAPEGGIAFQNIRNYVVGDDLRLVHWRSSAKLGELMVRHNVDNFQPRTLIILDTRFDVHGPASFEEAISAAASIVSAANLKGYPWRLRTSCGKEWDSSLTRGLMLDELARLKPSREGDLTAATRISRRRGSGYSLAVLTGTAPAEDLVGVGSLRTRYKSITIGRLGVPGRGAVIDLAGATVINARDAERFARAWNRRMRA